RDFVERELIPYFKNKDIQYWFSPEHIQSGFDWKSSIPDGLEECDWFILILSGNSVASDWVKAELDLAFQRLPGKIIPFVIDDCDTNRLNLLLRNLHREDARASLFEARNALLERLWTKSADDNTDYKTCVSREQSR